MPEVHASVLPKKILASVPDKRLHAQVSQILVDSAAMAVEAVLARFSTRLEGLTADDARARLAQYGPNVFAKDQRTSLAVLLWHAVINPLVILLAVLATISFATGDSRAGIVMSYDCPERRSEVDPGGQGRQRRGQAQGHDLGHRDRVRDGKPHEKSPSRNWSPATWFNWPPAT